MKNINQQKKNKIFARLFILIFLIKSLECLMPYSHGDALYYHLVAPKIWSVSSWSEMFQDLSHFVQAGYFDLIYFIPFLFSDSLISNHVFSQFLHFFFSIGLASLICFRWINHRIWGSLAAISMLTISKDSGFFHYAKNDGALALASLIAAWLVYKADYLNEEKRKINLMLTGFMLGLIPGIKMNGLLIVFPLSIYFIWQNRQKISNIFFAGGIASLVFIPALVKNYIYTGNIFFPILVNKFPGFLTQPMLDHYSHYYGNTMTVETFGMQFIDLLTGKFIFIFHPIIMWINYKFGRNHLNFFAWMAFSTFILYILLNGSLLQPRYFFASYFLLVLFIFMSLKEYSEVPKIRYFFSNKISYVIIIIIVLSDSKLDLSLVNIRDSFTGYYSLTEKEILRKEIPMTALWEKIEINESKIVDYVISDWYSSSYYLPKGVRLHTSKQSFGAEFLFECNNEEELLLLKKYKYFLLYYEKNNLCYDFIRNYGIILTKINDLKLYRNPLHKSSKKSL